MKETHLTIPERALIAGTRAVAGAGLGLLLAGRLSDRERRAVGWACLLFGALSTVSLAWEVFGKSRTLPQGRMTPLPSPEIGEGEKPASALART
jgi:hypothetical protein